MERILRSTITAGLILAAACSSATGPPPATTGRTIAWDRSEYDIGTTAAGWVYEYDAYVTVTGAPAEAVTVDVTYPDGVRTFVTPVPGRLAVRLWIPPGWYSGAHATLVARVGADSATARFLYRNSNPLATRAAH